MHKRLCSFAHHVWKKCKSRKERSGHARSSIGTKAKKSDTRSANEGKDGKDTFKWTDEFFVEGNA